MFLCELIWISLNLIFVNENFEKFQWISWNKLQVCSFNQGHQQLNWIVGDKWRKSHTINGKKYVSIFVIILNKFRNCSDAVDFEWVFMSYSIKESWFEQISWVFFSAEYNTTTKNACSKSRNESIQANLTSIGTKNQEYKYECDSV